MKIKFLENKNGKPRKAIVLNGEFGFEKIDNGVVKFLNNGEEFEKAYFNEITVNNNETYPFEEMTNIIFENDISEVKIEVEKEGDVTRCYITIE